MPFPMYDRGPNQQADNPFENFLKRWGQEIMLLLVLGTLVATFQQNEVMKQQLALAERPWVSVDIAAAEPLVFDENGAVSLLQFTLMNLGHAPASHVVLYFTALPILDMGGAHVKQREMCKRVRESRSSADRIVDVSETILPGGRIVQLRPFSIKKADIEKNTQRFPNRSTILLAVVGCADYQFTFAAGHHQTGFISLILRHDPKKPNSGFVVETDKGPLPAEQVGFSHIGGTYAD